MPVYYPYQPTQHQQQYPPQYGFYQTPQSLNIPDSILGPINSINVDGVQKQYLNDFLNVENIAKPMYADVIDASPIPEETIRHKLDNSLKEKMKITAEEIKNVEKEEESTQAKMKRNGNIISPDENIFGSTEFLNDEQIKSNDDDDFFDSDSFYKRSSK